MNQQQHDQLMAARERLQQEILMLSSRLSGARERLAGLETAIDILKGNAPNATGNPAAATTERLPRGGVKEAVLRIVQENPSEGVTAAQVVQIAAKQGITLERGSISSLLSKLKAAGTLELDGNRYMLPKPATPFRPAWDKTVAA